MNMTEKELDDEKMRSPIDGLRITFRRLRLLLNLRGDTDEKGTVESIRENVDFKSANAWTLVFAIFIASVGLDTNSTAVIIGAMLISPLMGPIIGMGLGLGVNDPVLVRRAARNLAFAVGISIVTSTIYFLISPLSLAQSELLARTRPTFFDVMIAFFGGAAGIVAQSRQTKGNAIPGVAIATALMPPLCTAGFGIASGQLGYVLGALYLFLINSVFICIATFLFVRYLKFARVSYQNPVQQKRIQRWVAIVAILVILPSLLLAWQLQRETIFTNRAAQFIEREMKFPRTFVVDREIAYNWTKPILNVGLIGDTLSPAQIDTLKAKMGSYDLPADALTLRQSSLEEDVERRLNEKLRSQDTAAQQAESKLSQLEVRLRAHELNRELGGKITSEIKGLFPQVAEILVLGGSQEGERRLWVLWQKAPETEERKRFDDFLKARTDAPNALVEHTVAVVDPPPPTARKRRSK